MKNYENRIKFQFCAVTTVGLMSHDSELLSNAIHELYFMLNMYYNKQEGLQWNVLQNWRQKKIAVNLKENYDAVLWTRTLNSEQVL